jgi:thymidylate synthase
MRIYKNCKQAINETKRNLYELGIEVKPHSFQNKIIQGNEEYETKELQGEVFSIINTDDKDDIVGKDLEWCKAEFQERISRKDCNPGEAWKLRQAVWEPFMKNNVHDYTYSQRFSKQLDILIAELKRNPDTRQAVLSMYNTTIDLPNIGGKKRTPCTMQYIMQIRKDGNGIPRLNLMYVQRSADFYTHWKNDIWLASEMKDYFAKEVGVQPGMLTCFIASLHMFKKDMEGNVY